MEYRFNTPLNGNIAMTYHYHEDAALRRDKSLYKFVWVQSGTLDIEVDHVVMHLEKDEIISLTPLHHVKVKEWKVSTSLSCSIAIFIAFTDMTKKCHVMVSCFMVRPTSCVCSSLRPSRNN